MVHDPLSPSEALRTKPGIILGGISLFIFVYSLIITAQLLLGGLLMLMLTLMNEIGRASCRERV